MPKYNQLYVILLGAFICACQSDQPADAPSVALPANTLFTEIASETSNIHFQNTITNYKDFNIFSYRNFYNGGGVGIGDINNDGLVDIYLTANLDSNRLYLNQGDFTFKDITATSNTAIPNKWSTGVTMVDINNDGFLDIYVCNAGYKAGWDQKNSLLLNNGDHTFREAAAECGLDQNDFSTHAAFFDYDKDGDLDVYLVNNSFIPVNTLNYSNKRELRAEDWPVQDFLKGGGDKLLRNDAGQFTDVSEAAGIYGSLIGFGLGATVGDVNGDGYDDIYISNDFFERDYLYINQQDGTFEEELENRISHLSHSSMGADMADINNDGAPEIFVTDMLPDDDYRLKTTSTFDNVNLRKLKKDKGFYNQYMHNTLQLNDGDGGFREISFFAGVEASDWSWGALMFDVNNDSYNDLFVSNGIYHDVIDQDFINFFANDVIQKMVMQGEKSQVDSIINKMPSVPLRNKLFLNQGNLKFKDTGLESGFAKTSFSNGAAYGDLDNDGDLDLVVNNVNQTAQVYENNAQNNFINFKVNYLPPNVNGIGTKIYVYMDGQTQMREVLPSRGFQSSTDYRAYFGLGEITHFDSVVVKFPNEKVFELKNLKNNSLNEIDYQDGKEILVKNRSVGKPLFATKKHNFPKHEEDAHNDFYYERNIPMQLSKEGPCAAVADLNNDGIDDLYIGGAADQPGYIYLSNKKGKYRIAQKTYFEKFKAFEDTVSEFFDADGDGDLDLFVGSGGNNPTLKNRAFRDRLYVNKDGNFELNFNAIPPITFNTSTVAPYDFDGDGDLDLFVGMRSVPGEYGMSPGSFLYQNVGNGQYREVTKKIAPDLSLAGMVTDAQWVDLTDHRGKELLIVGEWMSPKLMVNTGARYEVFDNELSSYAGFWQSLATTDLNQDGKTDLILGNIGENNYFKSTKDTSLLIFINDFDGNGAVDKILTRERNGKHYPLMVKADLADAIPEIKKENLMHREYAKQSISELFDADLIKTSVIKKVDHLSSVVAINKGGGHFEVISLIPAMQLSSINAIATMDVNKDGKQDLVIGGNNEYLLPQFSTIDASRGAVLINEDGQNFKPLSIAESGIDVAGTVREIKVLEHKKGKDILFLINDAEPRVYSLEK